VVPVAVTALLAVFVALCAHGLRWDSPTVDEFAHLPAGYYYLKTGNFALYNLNPPLVRLVSALPLLAVQPDVDTAPRLADNGWYPWVFGTDFMRRNRAAYDAIFLLGRLPIVVLGAVLGLLVWHWARRLYGEGGGLAALYAYALCPSIIAHAHLATTDIGFALAATGALYLCARWLEHPRPATLIAAGVALGLAQLTKFSAVILYPVLLLLAVAALARGRRFPLTASADRGRAAAAASSVAALAVLCLVSLLVLDAGYLFQGVGQPLAATVFRSHWLQRLAAHLPARLPAPLPAAYLSGFDAIQLINEQGEFPTYLFGSWLPRGTWAYYPLTLLFKTPLPLLAAWFVAPWVRPGRSAGARSTGAPDAVPTADDHVSTLASSVYFLAASDGGRAAAEAFLWVPALAMLAFFSLGSTVSYGIRYLLPILPLACIYGGRLVPWLAAPANRRRGRLARAVAVAALVTYPFSVLLATPDTIDYFNLLAGGHGDRIFLDSNLDWGQGLKRLRAHLDATGQPGIALAYFGHVDPAIYGIRWRFPQPDRPGPVAVSANFLHGYPYVTNRAGHMIPIPPDAFTWLNRYPRSADLGGGLYLYDVPAPGR
jgi:4-amino-4-deoxy-L-arabinose transferase-like glycosyltransferase